MESALMWRRDRDKHNQSSIKKYKSQCIGKLTWNLRFNFFQLWTQEFSSKIYQRVQDSKTSTFGACYIIKPRPYRQNNGNKEPKRTECWQTLNQKFRYHYFQTIINFYLEPQIVFMASNDWSRALKKIRAKKIAGLCARPFETWHKAPLFFHNHDSNSIHVLTSTLEFKVQWKKHPCTWIESALMWRRDRDKHNQSSIKKYKSQGIGKLTWNLRFNFFQLWTQEFSSKIYQRVQDSKTSTFGACYIIKPRPYRQNNGNKEPKRTECWQTLNQKFRYHYFQTIISFHLKPPIVFTASNDWSWVQKKIQAKKNSGALCRAIWDLTQSPAIFSQSRLKFNTCVDINFGVQSAMKKTHAPEWSRRWCGEGTGTNIISLRLKSTNHSALENWQWNLRFNFFQLWTQEFSSKIYQRVQDSKASTFGACYIIKPRPYRQNNGNKEPKRTECWQTLNQKFRYHYFQTIINFYLEPQIVFMASNDWSRALKKKFGLKK